MLVLPCGRRRLFVAGLVLLAASACTGGSERRFPTASPTSPTAVAATGAESTATIADTGTIERVPMGPGLDGGSPNVALDVNFPPRNEPLAFRQQLETSYRDQLRRSPTTSFVDLEGTIVWTQEYLRYRVNGCGNADAVSRVQAQIEGRGIQPVCADFTGTTVQFPPRNEPFAFRLELERIYRDTLRRGATQTFVDPEGDIVWTQEYLRYRLNRCSHVEATDRVLSQVSGGPVQPACDATTPPSSGPITNFVTAVSAEGTTATLIPSPRPNAGAGPIISASSSTGTQITLVASQPVDRVIVSVNTTGQALSMRLGPMAVLGSYYELKFSSPRSIIVVSIQVVPGTAPSFTLEFAAGLGNGPIGNYVAQPAVVSTGGLVAQPCSLEGTIRSTEGVEAAQIEFVNSSGQVRRIIWLDYNGRRVFYQTLLPGQSYIQPTFVTHPWISATSSDACQAIYLTPRGQSQAILR